MSTVSRQVALVVGGGDAITAAISRALGADGFDVAQASDRELSNVKQHGQLIDNVRHQFRRLDTLVVFIADSTSATADIIDASDDEFDGAMNTFVKGSYFFIQQVARWMVEQGSDRPSARRSIIIVSPSRVSEPRVFGAQTIANAGVAMVAQLWAHRLAEHGIAVFDVRTAKTVGKPNEATTPETIAITDEDVANAVASLARGDLHNATGSIINVDGGSSLRRL
jgi:NAD(P)-dependent dehydrogenase (short-subunit alcohol dehydrogenase family)